jgi:hypothetical protein
MAEQLAVDLAVTGAGPAGQKGRFKVPKRAREWSSSTGWVCSAGPV